MIAVVLIGNKAGCRLDSPPHSEVACKQTILSFFADFLLILRNMYYLCNSNKKIYYGKGTVKDKGKATDKPEGAEAI